MANTTTTNHTTTTTNHATPAEFRMVKKYQNRKLYDTKDSCYITLEDIAAMVKKGEEVRVIDNKTKSDVTSIILTQILVDQEKSTKSILPLTMLRDIIQNGHGSLFDFIQRYVLLGVNSKAEKQAEAERYINRLVDRGDITKAEGTTLLQEVMNAPEEGRADFEKWVGSKIANAVEHTQTLAGLHTTIENLTNRIHKLEQLLAQYQK
ncbi:MAG: polyhydroxyalkanoate synthesis regulator DNA-binding domain-containing protein [Bdellovibrionota bacterium]